MYWFDVVNKHFSLCLIPIRRQGDKVLIKGEEIASKDQ